MKKTIKTKNTMCPECGGKIREEIELFLNECDRCLANKVD